MKPREILAWLFTAILLGVAFAHFSPAPSLTPASSPDRHLAQTSAASTAAAAAQQAQLDRLEAAVKSLATKMDDLQSASSGGRFAFYTSGAGTGAYLLRIDRLKGDVAFYNDVGGAKWLVLTIPDSPVGESNSNFQRYITALRSAQPL